MKIEHITDIHEAQERMPVVRHYADEEDVDAVVFSGDLFGDRHWKSEEEVQKAYQNVNGILRELNNLGQKDQCCLFLGTMTKPRMTL